MTSVTVASTDHLSFYRNNARQIAAAIRAGWELSAQQDIKSLVDDVQTALTAQANQELRQVIFQLMAQMELAGMKATKRSTGGIDADHLARMRTALTRAAAIVNVYLDRNRAAQLVIPLDEEPFDLGPALREALRVGGFLSGGVHIEFQAPQCPVVADRDRLLDVLTHLAARLVFARLAGEELRVKLSIKDGKVQGFIGLTHSHITAQELLSEFDQPLVVEDLQLDIPYCRAVIERHGGTLYVAAGNDGANGFGFTLPTSGTAPETIP